MEIIDLNQDWQFAKVFDDEFKPGGEPAFETVSLPHTWYNDEDRYHGKAVYKKTVRFADKNKRYFLDLKAADQKSKIYINGKPVCEHKGGYSAFRVEIPEDAVKKGEAVIEALLDNSITPDVIPNFGDFTVFGGLNRGAGLIITNKDCFDRSFYGTDGVIAIADVLEDGSGCVRVRSYVKTEKEALCRHILKDENGKEVAECIVSANDEGSLRVKNPVLWNGKNDVHFYYLYSYLMADGSEKDLVKTRLGFKKVVMDPEKGLFLNGKRVKICGVAKHQDRAGVFNAVTDEMLDEDFDIIKEVGANGVRLSHYQHPEKAYDRCDEDGLLTWAEIPMLKMTENPELFANTEEQLKELIYQNIHHPSIFCWGIQNEIGMFKDAAYMHEECKKLANIAKSLDNPRLVTAANLLNVKPESGLNGVTDMVGYNLYFGWYYGKMQDYSGFLDDLHAKRKELPVGISEYGVDANIRLHSKEPHVRDYSEEYQALFHETVYPIFLSKDYLWGSYIWNMFDFSSDRRDEGGVKYLNGKGLVTHDRKIRKDAFYYYKAMWSDEPFVHICSKRFANRTDSTIDIKVYTNLKDVTLFVNDKNIAEITKIENGTALFKNVNLKEGKNLVKAISGKCCDEAVFVLCDTEDESYVLPDGGEGVVRNWFIKDEEMVKEGYLSILENIQEVLENARGVLEKYIPDMIPLFDNDVIPQGLALKSVLEKRFADMPDTMLDINKELNEIKKP